MVANRNKTGANPVKALMRNPCTECGGSLKKSAITQEFEHEGVVVRISGVRAWVCTRCGEIYFEPGGGSEWPKRSSHSLPLPAQKNNIKVLSLPLSAKRCLDDTRQIRADSRRVT